MIKKRKDKSLIYVNWVSFDRNKTPCQLLPAGSTLGCYQTAQPLGK
jgi:hypothetical protein